MERRFLSLEMLLNRSACVAPLVGVTTHFVALGALATDARRGKIDSSSAVKRSLKNTLIKASNTTSPTIRQTFTHQGSEEATPEPCRVPHAAVFGTRFRLIG